MKDTPRNSACDPVCREVASPGGNGVVLDVESLLAGAKEVRLRLRDEEYRLRLTKNNKLILTK